MDRSSRFRRLAPCLAAAAAAMLAMPAHGQSASECAARADRAARDSVGVTGGAVRGGLGGAAFGAIVGGGKGAATGAAVGAVVGGAVGGVRKDDVYKRVYDDCMRGR